MPYRAGYKNSPEYSTYGEYVNAQKDMLDPYSMLSSTVAGVGDMMDTLSEQNDIQAAGRDDLANYVVGNEWTDIFNNADRRSQGLKNIDANKIDVSNVNDINTLQNIGASNNLQDNVNYSQPDAGQVWGDVLGDAGKFAGIGAGIGSIIPGVGTAIGAGIGALAGATSGIIRGGLGSINNMRNAEAFNERINQKNAEFINDISDRAGIIAINQLQQAKRNMKAEGGELNGVNYEVGKEYDVDENTYYQLIKLGYGIEIVK